MSAKKYKRLLIKLSGEYLGGTEGKGYDAKVVDNLTNQVGTLAEEGYEIGIVLGGGNFFRGAQGASFPMDRVAGDQIGMLATLMNALYLKQALAAKGFKSRVMTGLSSPDVCEKFDKQKAIQCLKEKEIILFGGGTGNPFFTTDTTAVLRALEIEADIVIKGTKVDGVYDKDPMRSKSARKYDQLTFTKVLERDLKVMDQAAIALCRENKLPLAVINIKKKTDLAQFLSGKPVGTFVTL